MNSFIENLVSSTIRSVANGNLSRREAITTLASIGYSSPVVKAAFPTIGVLAQAARANACGSDGTFRHSIQVPKIADPRTFTSKEQGYIYGVSCDTLVRHGNNGVLVPRLLEFWEMEPDGLKINCRLRSDKYFESGANVTTQDVLWNFERWCDASVSENSMATRLNSLVDGESQQLRDGGFVIIDNYNFELHLEQPDIGLISSLADYPALILSPGFENYATIEAANAGTGAFEITEWQENNFASAKCREQNNWARPNINEIVWKDYQNNPEVQAADFASGEADASDTASESELTHLDNLGLRLDTVPTSGTVVVRMNVNSELYSRNAMRKGIQLGVSNDKLFEDGLSSRGLIAEDHHVSPVHPEYADIGPAEFDRDEAVNLFNDTGAYAEKITLVSQESGLTHSIAISTLQQLQDFGLNVELEALHPSEYWARWNTFPFAVTPWVGRPFGFQVLSLGYKSGAAWNETGFSDAEFDSLLSIAASTVNVEERVKIMAELERTLRESAVIIQPFWRNAARYTASRVSGFEVSRFPVQYYDGISLSS